MAKTISEFYDHYWSSIGNNNAGFYERDSVFPQIFHQKEKVLDLACGDGVSSKRIFSLTKETVSALEFSPIAAAKAKKAGIKVKLGSVEDHFPFKDNTFDTVFWGDNIEHIFFPNKAIAEIMRVLKPKGRLIISTPNAAYWRYRLYYLIYGRLPDTEYNGLPYWEWTHIRLFNLPTIQQFLNQHGFTVSRYWGINRRKGDKWLVKYLPQISGMILVIEANKK